MPTARLRIRVQPKARRNDVVVDGETIRVYVTTAPEGGKANKAVVRLLAKRLGVPKRDVEVVSGGKSRTKVISIEGLSEAEAFARLKSFEER